MLVKDEHKFKKDNPRTTQIVHSYSNSWSIPCSNQTKMLHFSLFSQKHYRLCLKLSNTLITFAIYKTHIQTYTHLAGMNIAIFKSSSWWVSVCLCVRKTWHKTKPLLSYSAHTYTHTHSATVRALMVMMKVHMSSISLTWMNMFHSWVTVMEDPVACLRPPTTVSHTVT